MFPAFLLTPPPKPYPDVIKVECCPLCTGLVFYLVEGTLGNTVERRETLESSTTSKSWILTRLIFEAWFCLFLAMGLGASHPSKPQFVHL